jgi:hypothetical protein
MKFQSLARLLLVSCCLAVSLVILPFLFQIRFQQQFLIIRSIHFSWTISTISSSQIVLQIVAASTPVTDFVHSSNGEFTLNGGAYRLSGTNVYYLHYMDKTSVDDVLNRAAAAGMLTVRMYVPSSLQGV